MDKDIDICDFKNCKLKAEVQYYDKHLCDKHFTKLCDLPVQEMKDKLGIKEKKSTISTVQEIEQP